MLNYHDFFSDIYKTKLRLVMKKNIKTLGTSKIRFFLYVVTKFSVFNLIVALVFFF